MNLQDFISTALVEIVRGVDKASQAVLENGASIGTIKLYGPTNQALVVTDDRSRPVAQIEFDIALAEGSSTDTKGGIGVYLGAVGLGSQASSHGDSSTHSRIKFSVPIIFPPAKGAVAERKREETPGYRSLNL